MNDITYLIITAVCMTLMSIGSYIWGYEDGKRKERRSIEELLDAYKEFYATAMPILLDTCKAGEQE